MHLSSTIQVVSSQVFPLLMKLLKLFQSLDKLNIKILSKKVISRQMRIEAIYLHWKYFIKENKTNILNNLHHYLLRIIYLI